MAGYDGYFLWHELMSTDPDGAKPFYSAVTGWTPAPGNVPGMDYTLWMSDNGPSGGLMLLPKEAQDMGAPTHWIPYIGASDADKTFARATELGARAYVPVMAVPGVGKFAVLADPQGATFGILQPEGPDQPHEGPKVGQFSWHEMVASDAPAALAFYGDLAGWEQIEAHDMGPMGTYHIYGTDGRQFGGMFTKSADMPFPPHWMCYIRVDNAEAAAKRITDNGGQILNGPMEVPGGDMIVTAMDPQGGAFSVHQMMS